MRHAPPRCCAVRLPSLAAARLHTAVYGDTTYVHEKQSCRKLNAHPTALNRQELSASIANFTIPPGKDAAGAAAAGTGTTGSGLSHISHTVRDGTFSYVQTGHVFITSAGRPTVSATDSVLRRFPSHNQENNQAVNRQACSNHLGAREDTGTRECKGIWVVLSFTICQYGLLPAIAEAGGGARQATGGTHEAQWCYAHTASLRAVSASPWRCLPPVSV